MTGMTRDNSDKYGKQLGRLKYLTMTGMTRHDKGSLRMTGITRMTGVTAITRNNYHN